MELSLQQCEQMYGQGDPGLLLKAMLAVAALTGLIKMIFSPKGKVTFYGITFQWGK